MAGRKFKYQTVRIIYKTRSGNTEIMNEQNKFQGLKSLHENLHSKRGFTSLNFMINSSCTERNKRIITTTGTKRESEENLASRSNPVEGTNNLLKAVKSVYVDNNVKLTEPKIFVGNISYKLSTDQLKKFFSNFGRVIYAQIVKDRVKKRSKGYVELVWRG